MEEVNFKTATEEARQLINSWVEKETNGKDWKMGSIFLTILTRLTINYSLSSSPQHPEKVGQARAGCLLLWKQNSIKWHQTPLCPPLQTFVCTRGGVSHHPLPCFFFKGQIQDFLEPGSVDLDTVLVLVNAVYFKGIWKTAFKEENTREAPFNVTEVGGYGQSFGQNSCWLTQSGCYTLNLFRSHVSALAWHKTQELCLTRIPGHISR